jgi:hypothetical protein
VTKACSSPWSNGATLVFRLGHPVACPVATGTTESLLSGALEPLPALRNVASGTVCS